jgi:acyl-coenzyme A synthetase/AMP-(fatty) acid ligase
MRTFWGDHARLKAVCFSQYSGDYFTENGCKRDVDGYYWTLAAVMT